MRTQSADSVCASPARLATGARIGPALVDDALIALSICERMVAQLERLRLRVLRERLPRPDATAIIASIKNRRRDPPAGGPDTRAVRAAFEPMKSITPPVIAQGYLIPGSVQPFA